MVRFASFQSPHPRTARPALPLVGMSMLAIAAISGGCSQDAARLGAPQTMVVGQEEHIPPGQRVAHAYGDNEEARRAPDDRSPTLIPPGDRSPSYPYYANLPARPPSPYVRPTVNPTIQRQPLPSLSEKSTGVFVITVQPGETLDGLAQRHGVSVSSFIAANKLTSTAITPGQRLRLSLVQ